LHGATSKSAWEKKGGLVTKRPLEGGFVTSNLGVKKITIYPGPCQDQQKPREKEI